MFKVHFCVPCISLTLVLVTGSAHAQSVQNCGDRAAIISVLAKKYEENPTAFGIAGQKSLVELFTSKAGSWTMLVTKPGGISCIMATGQSWEQFPPQNKLAGS